MRVWIRGVIAVVMALAVFLLADGVLQANGVGGFTPSAQELTDRAARWGEAPMIALGLSYWARSKTTDPDLLFSGQQTRARAWRDLGFSGPASHLMRETVLRAPTDNTVAEASYVFMRANDLDAARELTELVTGRQAPRLTQPDLAVSVYLSMLASRGRNEDAIAVIESLDTVRWSGSAKRRLDELRLYMYLAAQRPEAVLDWLREPAPAYCLEVRECAASRRVAEAQAEAMLGACDRVETILTELVDELRAAPFREEIDEQFRSDGERWSATISTSGQWACRALGLLGRREEAVDACLQDSGINPSTATAASREYAEYGVSPRLECIAGGTAG